jgi:hypothetical protein
VAIHPERKSLTYSQKSCIPLIGHSFKLKIPLKRGRRGKAMSRKINGGVDSLKVALG